MRPSASACSRAPARRSSSSTSPRRGRGRRCCRRCSPPTPTGRRGSCCPRGRSRIASARCAPAPGRCWSSTSSRSSSRSSRTPARRRRSARSWRCSSRLLREPLPVKLAVRFREDYLGKVKQLLAAPPRARRPGAATRAAVGGRAAGDHPRAVRALARPLRARAHARARRAPARRPRGALRQRRGEPVGGRDRLPAPLASRRPGRRCSRPRRPGPPRGLPRRGARRASARQRAAASRCSAQMVTPPAPATSSPPTTSPARARRGPRSTPTLSTRRSQRLERDSRLVRRERRRDIYLYEITSEFLVPWISRRREEPASRRAAARGAAPRRGARPPPPASRLGSVAGACRRRGGGRGPRGVGAPASATSLSARGLEGVSSSTGLARRLSSCRTRPDIALLLGLAAYQERRLAETRGASSTALDDRRVPGRRAILHGHAERGDRPGVQPRRATLASAGVDGTVRLWDARAAATRARRCGPRRTLGVAFSPDGRILASAGNDRDRSGCGTRGRGARSAPRCAATRLRRVAFSPDGRTLASAGPDATCGCGTPRTRRSSATH